MAMSQVIQAIKARLSQGSLQLDKEGLGSERLAQQVQQVSPNEVLQLDLGQNTITEADDYLHFQATAASLLNINRQSVEVVFFIHSDQLECLIKAVLPDYWDFSWSYPNLPDYTNYSNPSNGSISSFFYDFRFAQPLKILFSSYDYQANQGPQAKLALLDGSLNLTKIHQGLNYFSELDLSKLELLEIITEFAEISKKSLPFCGYIDQQGNDEQLKLIVDLSLSKSYEDIFAVGISSLIFYSSTSLYSINACSGIIFIGGLTIGSNQSAPGNIALIWPIGSTSLIIKNAEPIHFPGFDTFSNLLHKHLPTNSNSFPIDTNNLSTLEIREIVLQLSLAPPKLSSISLSVGTAEGWSHDLLEKAVVVEELLLKWEVVFGSSSGKSIEFYVLGAFRLGGGLVNVSAVFPDFAFYGELALYQTIELQQIFHGFLPNAPLPEVSILDLALSADVKQGNYALELDIASDWQIPLGNASLVPLKNLRISIQKDSSGAFATIDSVLNLAGADIILLATNANDSGVAGGWTFVGSTRPGQELPIGALMEDLAHTFGVTDDFPSALEELIIENLRTSFNTGTKDFSFTCEAQFEIEDQFVDIILTIDLIHEDDASTNPKKLTKKFGGQMTIGQQQFDLDFIQDQTSNVFVATYKHTDVQNISLKELIENVTSDSNLLAMLEDIHIDLKDALFAYSKMGDSSTTGSISKFLFGIDIGADVSLSHLPLVGKEFPPEQSIGVDNLQLLIASKPLEQTETDSFNILLAKQGFPALPSKTSSVGLQQGINVSAKMKFGGTSETLALPAASPPATNQPSPTPPTPPTPPTGSNLSTSDSAKWFNLQKAFGPVYFERVGVQYQDKAIWFLLDAALSVAGLTLALDGLAVGSPINHFSPEFNLHGLSIDYQKGPVEIGGAFLRLKGESYDEYDGIAVIKTEELTLTAIGSYAKLNGHPSLFIYAVLDYPLGGPAFFFVTGLAAGFGYNRALKIPSIDQVAQFPLVSEAVGGSGNTQDNSSGNTQDTNKVRLENELNSLRQYIPPQVGEIFFAVGIKFTSFKMIDSFVLLIVAFGDRFELDILGLSTLIAPTPEEGKEVPPLAEVQMALKASFIPSEGFLGVSAQLTSASYLFTRDCHLTGGFAFYTWFSGDHAGDFVQTLGGYSAGYTVAPHYPKVPRLGFSWQVNSELSLKGDAYYALTPAALMAGGHLQAAWQSGNLNAWFNAGADFLVAWKPYHYDAKIYVDMGVAYTYDFFGTHHITADVGADLHLWGPDFSGIAHIHLWIVSFTVRFGSGASQPPSPINWETFKASFLPADDDICTIAVKDGLVKKVSDDKSDLGVINPKQFSIVTNSVIPSNEAMHKTAASGFPAFGIGSMGVTSGELTSTHTITITKNKDRVEGDFVFTPILKNVPTGLWGQSRQPDLNGQKFIENALSGFEITPPTPPTPGATHAIDRANLQYSLDQLDQAYSWAQFIPFGIEPLETAERKRQIEADITRADSIRAELLSELGFSPEEIVALAFSPAIVEDFLVPPQIEMR